MISGVVRFFFNVGRGVTQGFSNLYYVGLGAMIVFTMIYGFYTLLF